MSVCLYGETTCRYRESNLYRVPSAAFEFCNSTCTVVCVDCVETRCAGSHAAHTIATPTLSPDLMSPVRELLHLMAGGLKGPSWLLFVLQSTWSCAFGLEMYKFWKR